VVQTQRVAFVLTQDYFVGSHVRSFRKSPYPVDIHLEHHLAGPALEHDPNLVLSAKASMRELHLPVGRGVDA
jgi:hypothetical protein